MGGRISLRIQEHLPERTVKERGTRNRAGFLDNVQGIWPYVENHIYRNQTRTIQGEESVTVSLLEWKASWSPGEDWGDP